MVETQLLLVLLLVAIISSTSIPEPILVSLVSHQCQADDDDRCSGTAVEIVADLVPRRGVRRDV
jgi:hypothetical protein